MSKLLKVMILGISALLLILPAHAQEARSAAQAPTQAQAPAPSQSAAPLQTAALSQSAAPLQSAPPLQAAAQPQASAPPKAAQAQALAKEQIKGLDEQVQEIKTDVLGIATELNRLEEKLLYPSDTQIAIFVSVPQEEKFRLDAVTINLDGKTVAHHLYTYKELEALKKGGVQRIYVGNVKTGEHPLQVTVSGKSEGGSDFQKEESFKVAKGIGPKMVGVVLAGTGIGSKPITLKDW